jgi:ACS family hexuronate transporter-like MFS transporter
LEPTSDQPTSARPPLSTLASWSIAVVATLAMSVSYLDRQALSAVAKTVRTDLHIDHAQYGLLAAGFGCAYLVGAPLAGVMLDRVGARRGMVIAVLVWSAVAALHSAAGSFASLLLLRVLLGLAESPSFPGAVQAMRRALPPAQRSAGAGLLFTGSSVGAMVAAPLALYLSTKYDWRLAFVVIALVGLLWIPVWLVATRRLFDGASTELAAPVSVHPAQPLFARRSSIRSMLLVFTSAPAIMLVLTWFPQYLAEGRQATAPEMARVLWIPPVAFDMGALGFGALGSALRDVNARPPRWLVGAAALLASTLAFVHMASSIGGAVAIASVCMAGGAGLYVLVMADLLTQVPPSETSRAGGMLAAAQSLAHIIANPMVGVIVDRTHTFTAVMVGLGVMVLPGAMLWMYFPAADRKA